MTQYRGEQAPAFADTKTNNRQPGALRKQSPFFHTEPIVPQDIADNAGAIRLHPRHRIIHYDGMKLIFHILFVPFLTSLVKKSIFLLF
jgi:hypothetical protein